MPTLAEVKKQYDNVEKWAKPEKAAFDLTWTSFSPTVAKEPKGTVLIINPFNYPLWVNFVPLVSIPASEAKVVNLIDFYIKAGAIAAGCTVLIKPSEQTPACSSLVAELLHKYLDNDIVRVVNGAVSETTKVCDRFFFNHFLMRLFNSCWNSNGITVSTHYQINSL